MSLGSEASSPAVRRAWIGVGLALGAALAWLGVREVDLDEVWAAVRRSEWIWLLPSLGVLAVGVGMRALRWQLLFAAAHRPPLAAVTRALLVGLFFNIVLPFRAGEAARLVALYRRTRTSRMEIAATIAIERVYDIATLLLLLFAALPWLPDVAWVRTAGWLALGLGLALLAAVVVLTVGGATAVGRLLSPLRLLPFFPAERLEAAQANVLRGLAGLRELRTGVVAVSLTTASWIVLAAAFWLVTLAFDLNLPFHAGILVLVATGLALVIPSPPAALGVWEAATVVALDAYDVPLSLAVSYGLVLHAVNVVPFLVAGIVVLPSETRKAW